MSGIQFKPVGVFWDIENCSVPKNKSASAVIAHVRNFFVQNRLNHREFEFLIACDITRLRKDISDDVNRAGGVTMAHVNGSSKNAADEKIRENMRKFVDTHAYNNSTGTPVLVLISGDIDFVNDLRGYQTRNGCTIVIIHTSNCSPQFKVGWNEIYNFQDFCAAVPFNQALVEKDEDSTPAQNFQNPRGPNQSVRQRCPGPSDPNFQYGPRAPNMQQGARQNFQPRDPNFQHRPRGPNVQGPRGQDFQPRDPNFQFGQRGPGPQQGFRQNFQPRDPNFQQGQRGGNPRGPFQPGPRGPNFQQENGTFFAPNQQGPGAPRKKGPQNSSAPMHQSGPPQQQDGVAQNDSNTNPKNQRGPRNQNYPGQGNQQPQGPNPNKKRKGGQNNQGMKQSVENLAQGMENMSMQPPATEKPANPKFILMAAGLPGKMDFRILKEHLQEKATGVHGKVKYVKNGQAFISFNHKSNADRAVELFNGIEVYGKTLNVSFVQSIPFENPIDKKLKGAPVPDNFVLVDPKEGPKKAKKQRQSQGSNGAQGPGECQGQSQHDFVVVEHQPEPNPNNWQDMAAKDPEFVGQLGKFAGAMIREATSNPQAKGRRGKNEGAPSEEKKDNCSIQ